MAAIVDWNDNPDWFDAHPGNTAGGGNYVLPEDQPAPDQAPVLDPTQPPPPDQALAPQGTPNGNASSSGYQDMRPGLPDLSQFKTPNPLQPWTGSFTAPTYDEALNTPGFQFRLGEGMKALQRSAAAKGTLLTGGTLKGMNDYAQSSASQEYGNTYNRAYNEYDTRRTDFLTNEANRYRSEAQNLGMNWGINSDYFNMGRANRMDDFGIFNTNRNYDFGVFDSNRNFSRGLNQDWLGYELGLVNAGRPPSPSTV